MVGGANGADRGPECGAPGGGVMASRGIEYQCAGCKVELRPRSTETERGGQDAMAPGVVADPGLGIPDSGERGYAAYEGVTAEVVFSMRPPPTGDV